MDINPHSQKLIVTMHKLKNDEHKIKFEQDEIMNQAGIPDDYQFWMCMKELMEQRYIDGYNFGSPIETQLIYKGIHYKQVFKEFQKTNVRREIIIPIVVAVVATLITLALTWVSSNLFPSRDQSQCQQDLTQSEAHSAENYTTEYFLETDTESGIYHTTIEELTYTNSYY